MINDNNRWDQKESSKRKIERRIKGNSKEEEHRENQEQGILIPTDTSAQWSNIIIQ